MSKRKYQAENYRGKTIEKKGNKFRIYVGQRVTCETLDEARSAIDKHLDKLAVVEKQIVRSSPIRIDDGFGKFIAAKMVQNLRGATIRNYWQMLDLFKKEHPSLEWVHQITDDLWERWTTRGSLGSWKQVSKWQEFVQLRGFVRWCARKGFFVNEAFANYDMATGKGEVEGKRPATQEEVEQVLKWAKGKRQEIYVVILLAISYGVRPAEMTRIRKEDWNSTARTLRIFGAAAKTKLKREFQVGDELALLFDNFKKSAEGSQLLNSTKGKPWTTDGLASILKRGRRQAGMPPDISLYSLRKFAANNIASKADMRTAYQVLGHTDDVHAHYYRSSPEAQRQLAASISSSLNGECVGREFGVKVNGQWRVFQSMAELTAFEEGRRRQKSNEPPPPTAQSA